MKRLYRYAALLYFEWALSEIDPLHPDVPVILHKVSALRDELGVAA